MGTMHAVILLLADVDAPEGDTGEARRRLQSWLDENLSVALAATGLKAIPREGPPYGFTVQGLAIAKPKGMEAFFGGPNSAD